ncbi:family 16 glycoside hydrolase [Aeoliella sp.]|uniref:family 16 glycoside hydrolase n=1 Tax=Aeoliella sp. TaxID=2795800 RepID=UPI003CCB884A
MRSRYAHALTLVLASLCLPGSSQASDATTQPSPRDARWLKRHEAINEKAKQSKWDLVFIGDSITDGWDGGGKAVWQQFYEKRNVGNLGIGGDQTQHVVYRIENGNLAGQSPKLAVIMIGTNNLGRNRFGPADTIEGIQAVVDSVRKATPDTKILLLGVFPRGQAADDPFRAKIEEVNQSISELADWETIHYLDIGPVFLEDDDTLSKEIMPDFLHLSKEGYQRWADAIESKVAELMDEEVPAKTTLFDGKTLDGWTNEDGDTPPKGWAVVDGTLAVTGWGEDAFTTKEVGDFEFEAEWRLPPKGNGGIFYRVADYRYIWLGPEYQLADDLTRGYKPSADNSTGSNIDLYGPDAGKPVRPHGEWNHTRIVVHDNHVEHWLNGELILEYDFLTDDWHARVKDSKFSRLHPYFGQPQRGKFKLENHVGSEVQFRDITVREL